VRPALPLSSRRSSLTRPPTSRAAQTVVPVHQTTHEAPVVHASVLHEPLSLKDFVAGGGDLKSTLKHDAEQLLNHGEVRRLLSSSRALSRPRSDSGIPLAVRAHRRRPGRDPRPAARPLVAQRQVDDRLDWLDRRLDDWRVDDRHARLVGHSRLARPDRDGHSPLGEPHLSARSSSSPHLITPRRAVTRQHLCSQLSNDH